MSKDISENSIILFPDENLYEIFIRCKLDVADLEKSCESLGTLVATIGVHDSMIDKLPRITQSPSMAIWKKKLWLDYQKYLDLLRTYSENEFEILCNVRELGKMLRTSIRPLDKGAVSKVDLEIFANAIWFGTNTNITPYLISDDGDLLRTGHMISSYFGFPLIVLSVYEFLSLTQSVNGLIKYCETCNLPMPHNPESIERINIIDFKDNLSAYLRSSKLSLHPLLTARATLDGMCSVKKGKPTS